MNPRRPQIPSPLAIFPGDVLVEIATCLSRSDILHFSLTSTRLFSNIVSVLYAEVALESSEQCITTLGMLQRRPDIARHIRKLVVRPEKGGKRTHRSLHRSLTCAAICSLALRLDALTTFEWDAEELPPDDDMWFSLRMHCPLLRRISTSVGFDLPLDSHAFAFVDLIGFSLCLKSGYYKNRVESFLDDDVPSARSLWTMLKRCPNLEELAIAGSSPHPTDAHRLVEGRWPKLRKLILGDVIIDWQTALTNPDAKRPLVVFLEAHDNLESLSLSEHNIHHTRLSSLSADSLPHLKEFSGTLEQFRVLHHLHPSLKSVTFCDPMLTRELTPLAIAVALQNLRGLTKLKVSFVLHSMYHSASLLRSLFTACPTLEHLELTCAHRPSLELESFSKHIGNFSKLRFLSLTIIKYPGDETISTSAVRIARANPRLQTFNLTFMPALQPFPLPFVLPFILPSTRATGTYTLKRDEHGLPLSLVAREKHRRNWPWGFGVYEWSKRYTHDLRPAGYPAWKKDSENTLRLILDRSPAGKEVRMLLFCVSLVCLALWAVVSSGAANE